MAKKTLQATLAIILSFSANYTVLIAQVQENNKIVSSEYDRFAFTYLLNDFRPDNYNEMKSKYFSGIKVPDKYFNNQLISPNLSKLGSLNMLKSGLSMEMQLHQAMEQNKVANQVIAKWFNQQSDGSFNMDLISERGKYNASMEDIKTALMSERGLAIISDAGEKLINKSYILVFDIKNIKTMDEIAAEKKKKPGDTENNYLGNTSNEAKQNGYRAKVVAYLYKITFNDSVAAIFYNDMWIHPDQADHLNRVSAFDQFNFPVQFVTSFDTDIKSAQINPGYNGAPTVQKSKEQLFKELVLEGVENIQDQIEKLDQFAVKANIVNTKPIQSRIGRKEGLYVDQRYFVYQNRGDRKTGEIKKSKRMAVIRAKNVVDNRKLASDVPEPSEFYQVAGRKIEKYSMFISQKNDIGVGLSAGLSSGAFDGPMVRLEANIAQFGKATGDFPTGLKLYGDLGIGAEDYTPSQITDVKDNSFSFIYLSAGLARELYFARYFQLTPYAGYVYENASWTDALLDEDESKSIYVHAFGMGATLGMNLMHNLQVKFTGNLHFPLSLDDSDENLTGGDDVKWTDLFEGRSGFSQIIQLRILF
jgi:hypothetical protein